MNYLVLVFLSIIVYMEILPTVSIFFELIRTWLASKIAVIQQITVQIQEEIQEMQNQMEPNNSVAIGFHTPSQTEVEEQDYE